MAILDERVVAGDAAVITGPPKELERDAVVAVLIHMLDWCSQSGEVKAGERAKIAIDHPFAPLMAERAFGSVRAGRRRRFLHPDEYWALQELRDALEEQEIRFEITAYDKAPRQAEERAAAALSRAGDQRPRGDAT